MPKVSQLQSAMEIRDRILPIFKTRGHFEPLCNMPSCKIMVLRNAPWSSLLTTPFSKVPWTTPSQKYQNYDIAVLASQKDVMDYRLDFYFNKKVLSLQWSDDGRAEVISFKRGEWERADFSIVFS